jgi:Tfp pilus assembly protein PilF
MARVRNLSAWLWRHRRRALVLVLLVALLGFGAYWLGCYLYAESHLRAADEAEARYDFDEAVEHLTACLRVRPRSAPLLLQLARAERRAGRPEQAAAYVKRCEQLTGGVTPEISLEWALARAQSGDLSEVERALQQRADNDEREAPQILEALAKGYIETYRLDAAKYCLDRLLALQPGHVEAMLWRASLWQTAGSLEKAEADYRRALDAQPEHRAARSRLAALLLRRNQAAKALEQYDYLRHLPGGDRPEVLLGLARCNRELGHAEAARQELDAVLAGNPHDGDALIERGKLALETESAAAAEGWLRRALTDHPFDAQGHYLLAQALRRQGHDAEALEHEAARQRIQDDLKLLEATFRRVAKAPTDPEPRREAGQICLRNGQEEEGERWLLSALQQAPHDRATHLALAGYYDRAGKADLAADHRRQAGTADTDSAGPRR